MKKIVVPILTFVLFASAAIAANQQDAGQQSQGTGQGQQVQTETQQQTQNQGEEQQIQTEQQTQTGEGEQEIGNQQGARTMTEAREMVQQKKQEMTQEMQSLSNVQQKVYQNQNKVREAVHALLAIEDLAPGIGPQISQIAQQFNNSVQATIMAEEKIQKRSAFVRFFMGGEKDAAQEMEQELNQNQERIQELKQLQQECTACSEGVRTMIQEQAQNMEQEQIRLRQLAEKEKNTNGVFGWIKNLFGWGR